MTATQCVLNSCILVGYKFWRLMNEFY